MTGRWQLWWSLTDVTERRVRGCRDDGRGSCSRRPVLGIEATDPRTTGLRHARLIRLLQSFTRGLVHAVQEILYSTSQRSKPRHSLTVPRSVSIRSIPASTFHIHIRQLLFFLSIKTLVLWLMSGLVVWKGFFIFYLTSIETETMQKKAKDPMSYYRQ